MKIKAYIKNIRLSHWWWWIGVCAIGAYAFSPGIALPTLLLIVLGFSFLFASVYTLNNTYDHVSDRWNPSKSNPVSESKISYKESKVQSVVLAFVGLTMMGIVSLDGFIAGVILSVLNVLYHIPPFRSKSRPFFDIVSITLLYSTPFFVGYSAVNSIDMRGISLALLFGMLSGMVHPFQTAKDIEQDRKNGDKTVSVTLGIKRSVILSLALVVLTMSYFEFLVFIKILDPKVFFYPLTFIPSIVYYLHTIIQPSDKKIDKTVRILRINGIIGGIIPLYMII